MDFGGMMQALPAAMQQVDGIAGTLERIALALERLANVAEHEYDLKVQVGNDDGGDTPDPGDHYVRPQRNDEG